MVRLGRRIPDDYRRHGGDSGGLQEGSQGYINVQYIAYTRYDLRCCKGMASQIKEMSWRPTFCNPEGPDVGELLFDRGAGRHKRVIKGQEKFGVGLEVPAVHLAIGR